MIQPLKVYVKWVLKESTKNIQSKNEITTFYGLESNLLKSRQLTHFVSKKALWLLYWTSSYIVCKDVCSPQITTKWTEALFILNIICQTLALDGWPMNISIRNVHLCHSFLQFSSVLLILYLFIGILSRRFQHIFYLLL